MPNHATCEWRPFSANSLKPVRCDGCARRTRFPHRYGFHYRLTRARGLVHHRTVEHRCGACLTQALAS